MDWTRFLDVHHIEWSRHGSTRNNVSIRCPWCGSGDPSQHLTINLDGAGYRCFRNRSHSGRSAPWLIQALLQCSWPEAQRLAGVTPTVSEVIPEKALGKHLAQLINGDKPKAKPRRLRLLSEFRPVEAWGVGRYFTDYLETRLYTAEEITKLQRRYKLVCAVNGAFAWRVVFPIFVDEELVTWTGRSIDRNARLRYRTLSADPETARENGLPAAILSIERTLWNYDQIAKGGRELLLCEGPFDAMRLDFYGKDHGIRAGALFTKSISNDQMSLLSALRERFENITLVLDQDAWSDWLPVSSSAAHLGIGVKRLPRAYKDPAMLPKRAALEFLEKR